MLQHKNTVVKHVNVSSQKSNLHIYKMTRNNKSCFLCVKTHTVVVRVAVQSQSDEELGSWRFLGGVESDS